MSHVYVFSCANPDFSMLHRLVRIISA